MKSVIVLGAALLATAGLLPAQSPAATASATVGGKSITVTYNSPKVNGRAGKLFGKDGRIGQDRTYPVWRAGANSATKLHTDADLDIGGISVQAGDYTLFVDLTDPAAWQLIINKQTGQWGLSYDKSRDVGRAKMMMARTPSLVEDLKYAIADLGGNKGTLTLQWENVSASVPLTVK